MTNDPMVNMKNKKIIFDYIANLLEKDKKISEFDPTYKSISKEYLLRDIIKRFDLKQSDAYKHCSYHDLLNNG